MKFKADEISSIVQKEIEQYRTQLDVAEVGTVLEVGDGVTEVKSTDGDTELGGDDIDNAIISHMALEFQKEQGVDLSKDKMALQRLKEAAEKAKVELSATTETEINLPYVTADASGPKHLVMKLSRAKLESLCQDVFKRLLEPCKSALKEAGLQQKDSPVE